MTPKEIEPQRETPIARDEFFMDLEIAEEHWQDQLSIVYRSIERVETIRHRVLTAERSGLTLQFYRDEGGNIGYRIKPKGIAGFNVNS